MRSPGWRKLGRILLHVLIRGGAALVVLLAISALAGLVVVQSGWFHEYVRLQIIADIERATGGRVELGRFSFRGPTLTARVAQLVLHGKEAAGEPPLLRVESVTLRLGILSFAERKIDLASIQVEQPQVRIVIYPDGSNNLPGPQHNWPEELLNLAVGRYQVTDGMVELDERSIPMNLLGEGLALKLAYDPRTPSYLAELKSRKVRALIAGLAPIELGLSSRFALEKSRLVISALRLSTRESHADLQGVLENILAPHGTFKVQAAASLRDVVAMFPVPLAPTGTADFTGVLRVSFTRPVDFGITGRVNARGAGYSNGRIQIKDAGVRGQVSIGPYRFEAKDVEADALGAHFTGMLSLGGWQQLHAEGSVDGLSVTQAASLVTPRLLPWNGTLAGSFMVDSTLGTATATAGGVTATQAHADLTISPAALSSPEQGAPIEGRLDASYNQDASEVTLGSSYVATPGTRLDVSGTVGRRLEIQLHCTNLGDVAAALPLFDETVKELPVKLNGGSVTANGTVTGPLDDPRFRGQVEIVNGSVEGHAFDHFTAGADLSQSQIEASGFVLSRGPTEATGDATFTPRPISGGQNGFADAAVAAQFNLRNANVEELLKEAGSPVAAKGTASAGVSVSGSLGEPRLDVTLDVANPEAFGEAMDRVRATLKADANSVEISNGQAEDGPARLTFSGAYQAAGSDWRSGSLQVQLTARNLEATRLHAFADFETGVDGRITADVRAQGGLAHGAFSLSSVAGTLSAQSVSIHGQPAGEVTITAETRGQELSAQAKGKMDRATFDGQGSWRLDGDQSGSADLRFSRMTIDDVHRLAMLGGMAPHQAGEDLPLEGFVDGVRATVSMALSHPRDFQASVTLDTVQFNPKAGQALGLGVQPQDIVLKNTEPVVFALTAKEVKIQSARLTGRDTNIEMTGTVPFATSVSGGGGADLALRGTVSLVALQLLNPDLLAKGNATVEASLRGSLSNPSLNGRMDLKGASLYMKDVTTGVDNANGTVLFNRNRATIDKMTAEVGSGTISLGGFVEFGSPLIYRLQAKGQQVRLRLLDLSTTFNANLELTGTSEASTLSGTMTLNRAAFNPRSDLGQLLASATNPVQEGSPNDYLRGMQFDVRIVSAASFELRTSLTQDVQGAVDLQVRGPVVRPILLGSISVDSGQVQVFGNQYTIDRGDIRFSNPVKIEPVFDLALETRVSGVTVNITLTGTMDKLKPNYSSDPPLESSKIIALLAVGRDPSQYGDAASAQTASDSSNFAGAGGGLISEALSEQLSSKLQRFFGASRVKLDPTDPIMTGIINTPQARLTIEQQVSKDVTMTYITNLNYTAEQIVRVQWDLTPTWSAIAVRDANGLFGIDFQYRRRF
jgi:translocation and assembly module TamB